jgi:signal peptidase I
MDIHHTPSDATADVSTPSVSSVLPQQTTSQSTPPAKKESFVVEIFKFAVLALVIVVPFRMFIAQPFIVSGASMVPTFETGQYLIVDQLTYHLERPARGDVVVFRFPGDTTKFFIKRVIGEPNETIQLRGKDVTIKEPDGKAFTLDEPYLDPANVKDDYLTVTLGPDEYFVMGDNRAASSDSRVWGPVPAKLLVGRAFVRLLPLNEIGIKPGSYSLPANPPSQ